MVKRRYIQNKNSLNQGWTVNVGCVRVSVTHGFLTLDQVPYISLTHPTICNLHWGLSRYWFEVGCGIARVAGRSQQYVPIGKQHNADSGRFLRPYWESEAELEQIQCPQSIPALPRLNTQSHRSAS